MTTVFRPYSEQDALRSDRSAGDRKRHREKLRRSIKENIADIIVRLVERAVRGPFVLLVEEAHWADSASIAACLPTGTRTTRPPCLCAISSSNAVVDRLVMISFPGLRGIR